jgi:hypothetical protein
MTKPCLIAKTSDLWFFLNLFNGKYNVKTTNHTLKWKGGWKNYLSCVYHKMKNLTFDENYAFVATLT